MSAAVGMVLAHAKPALEPPPVPVPAVPVPAVPVPAVPVPAVPAPAAPVPATPEPLLPPEWEPAVPLLPPLGVPVLSLLLLQAAIAPTVSAARPRLEYRNFRLVILKPPSPNGLN